LVEELGAAKGDVVGSTARVETVGEGVAGAIRQAGGLVEFAAGVFPTGRAAQAFGLQVAGATRTVDATAGGLRGHHVKPPAEGAAR